MTEEKIVEFGNRSRRWREDISAVRHAARRAVETLIIEFNNALGQGRRMQGLGPVPYREWLISDTVEGLIPHEGRFYINDFRRLQNVIYLDQSNSDDHWVEKEIARFFKSILGNQTVELDIAVSAPRFREVSYMPLHAEIATLQPQFHAV